MCDIKPWEITQKFNIEIEKIAVSRISKFYPSYIAKKTNLPLGIVIDKLDGLEKEKAVNINLEFLCEECSRNILTLNKQDQINESDLEITCKYCGANNNFNPLDGIPVVELDDGFRSSFSKKKQLNQRLLMV